MDADRWQHVSVLYHAARARAEEERPAFLDSACGDDDTLRQEVEALLAHDASAESFLAMPAADALTDLINLKAETVHRVAEARTTLGSYRIERLLGRGGMGVVYLAYDTILHRQVALKVVSGDANGEASRTRLLREARNAAALNHPNICTIHEVSDANGTAFIAMEYVEGRSLRDRLDEGAVPLEDAFRYGMQAADALSYAHEHGVIHRDFKAANAIVTEGGWLKIVDFGLARRVDARMADATTMASLAPAGVAAGTPYAMAPEQVRGETTDARTDVWAFGVLLYEMVTGAQPFTAATIPELFSSILRDAPRPLPDEVPAAIAVVIGRCLEKEPERRYRGAEDIRRALQRVQTGTVTPWAGWRYHLNRRRWLVSTASLIGAAAVLAGFNVGGVRDRIRGHPLETAPIRLAVLPFENLTGDPDQEYFSDGLTEEMITQLGRLHPQRLSVIARTSSMRYKNRDVPINQIGRELGVDYVLEGSARREGARVRVSTTLVDVRDGTQRWADTFERELSSILTLQSNVARGVAESLALTLLPSEESRLASVRTVNGEAYEAYLKGLNLETNPSPANLNAALRYFELALERDASYAPAYTGVAGVWFARLVTSVASKADVATAAKAAIDKALARDDSLADAHFRLAEYNTLIAWDWAAADREFRRAIELNPNQASTRSLYADYLAIVRRPDEALAQAARAMELDPVSTQSQAFYARILMFTRRYDEAIAQYRETLRGAPDQQIALANIRVLLHAARRYDQAFAADQAWAASNATTGGPDISDALSRGYAEGGYQGAMRRAAAVEAARAPTNPAIGTFAAQFYVRAGDKAMALDWLEKMFEAGEAATPYLSCAPIWDDLRGEPRFQALLHRMHLPG